jgi:hypothetical protein
VHGHRCHNMGPCAHKRPMSDLILGNNGLFCKLQELAERGPGEVDGRHEEAAAQRHMSAPWCLSMYQTWRLRGTYIYASILESPRVAISGIQNRKRGTRYSVGRGANLIESYFRSRYSSPPLVATGLLPTVAYCCLLLPAVVIGYI